MKLCRGPYHSIRWEHRVNAGKGYTASPLVAAAIPRQLCSRKDEYFNSCDGYLIIFNENFLRYVELSKVIFENEQVHNATLVAPVSWRLILVYFGLCFLAVGSILYQWFCSGTVKQFASASEFVAATLPHMGDLIPDGIEAHLRENDESLSHLKNTQEVQDRRQMRSLDEKREEDKDALSVYRKDLLSLFYVTLDQQWPIARILTAAAYTVGFAILAIPTINVFWRVTVITYDRALK